ncbi:glycosyltransferase [Falsirhodobacter algicola]|uniref:Glycosyltransferase n=1 Tax=Falsirhodobacter algicola TaxID=2692330 RepID=A0A8J8SM59_9RHOB|nr:glycosyltransferase [Falsirhodobacter algicola]QUS37124.1 glycosyltransferase [Falsirhodobacter algicola]
MKIALIAHVRHPIAPPFMGGMEAHSWNLAHALIARGHEVTLFASGDSDPAFRLHPVLPEHYDRIYPWNEYVETKVLHDYLDAAFEGAMQAVLSGGFDVVHNNSLHRYPPRMARARRMPMVTSLHIPPFDALHRAVRDSAAPWSRFTVTSGVQTRCWWPEGAPDCADVVHNGIDLSAWPEGLGGGPAVWAGRITRTKAPHLAVQAMVGQDLPLRIYGVIEDRAYFDAEIAPHLSDRITYGGHLPTEGLAQAFGAASVLMFTPMWNEPFGLIAAEAMACGTPVAGFDIGAVAEVVGDAGVLVPPGDVAALRAVVPRAARIPRRIARARALRFGQEAMVDGYEAAYAAAIAGRTAPAPPVRFPGIELPSSLARPRRRTNAAPPRPAPATVGTHSSGG